ncbi:MAG: hypothetical protein ACR2GQ_03890 [Gemmatimonadota bacterium]|jgi:hypothetical protein
MNALTRPIAVAVGLLGVAVAMPGSSAAQDLDAACRAIGGSSPGAWTQHTIKGPNGNIDMRFALVADRGATWYEIKAGTPQGESIVQMEVPGFPFTPDQIRRVVMKNGSGPALRLPDSMVDQYKSMAEAGPLTDIEAQCRTAEVVGEERIDVGAGSFMTTHLRFPGSGGEVWVSEEVPFGIVRGVAPGQGTMELTAHGTGATSAITETPFALPATGGANASGSP